MAKQIQAIPKEELKRMIAGKETNDQKTPEYKTKDCGCLFGDGMCRPGSYDGFCLVGDEGCGGSA